MRGDCEERKGTAVAKQVDAGDARDAGKGGGAEDGVVVPRSQRILEDPYFFEADYAAGRLADVKRIREEGNRLNFVNDGRFPKKPKLKEMIVRYGEPDLVVATRDYYMKGAEAESYTVTAFYDRVGFGVYAKDHQSQIVHLVTAQYNDFSLAVRPREGKFFYEIAPCGARMFFSEGKEVGLHVSTGRNEWETVGTLPEGEYAAFDGMATYGRAVLAGDGGRLEYNEPGGARKEVPFENGRYDGVYREYGVSGLLKQEIHYRSGRIHGKFANFYENGQRMAEANYQQGRIHGEAREYHPNGMVRAEMTYKYGTPVTGLKEFDESGQLVREVALGDTSASERGG